MPFVQINIPAGSAGTERLRALVAGVTDAVVAAEGGSDLIRQNVQVHVVEVADGGYGIAGRAYTTAEIQAATGTAGRGAQGR